MYVNIPALGNAQLYNYRYDQLNRLVSADAWKQESGGFVKSQDFAERYTHDANGNILSLQRNGNTAAGKPLAMDNLTYNYLPGTNKLDYIQDAVPDANYANDIDNQQKANYLYDAIGNMTRDAKEGIVRIDWTVYNKIQQVTKADGSTIRYTYDATGNRITKTTSEGTTIYVRDAQGNVLSVYEQKGDADLQQSEVHLYGSSRLGVKNVKRNVETVAVDTGTTSLVRGIINYELLNHLGNVMATISDKKIAHSNDGVNVNYYSPDVRSATDYYAFGSMMPGRNLSSAGYRYGFNSHEKSDEVTGEGNHTTALYGEYDTRLGRRWNPDPRPTVGLSLYSVFLNNPIWHNDILLDTPTTKQAALMANNSYANFDLKNPEQKALKDLGWNRVEKIKTNLFGRSNQEVSLDDIGAATGFNMALYSRTLNGKTEWVLANAGTADAVDVGSDVRNLTGNSDQYAFSVRFAKALQNSMGGQEMTYVGHSLGGGLAAANSLATGNAAITFNPAGVSWGTRMANNLPKDNKNGQIQSFVVGGEAIDRSQRLVGSRANGKTTYIHPELGKINGSTALFLRFATDVKTSVNYHMMSVVLQALDKAGIK